MHHEAERIQGGPGQGACITQRERHDCDQRAVRSAHLEDQVGKWLTTLVIPADWRADIKRLQRREAQGRNHNGQRPAVPREPEVRLPGGRLGWRVRRLPT